MNARTVAAAAAVCLLAGCGGGGGGSQPTPSQTTQYQVGGTVSGSRGPVVLQLNGGETLSVPAAGPFTFSAQLASGASYSVSVITQPASQSCSVTAALGVVNASVTTVQVQCADVPPPGQGVSGTVTGLTGPITLQVNGFQLTVAANGAFSFPGVLPFGAAYQVTVVHHPFNQLCELSSAAGMIGTTPPNVVVDCETLYSVGVIFGGVSGNLVVANNGAETMTISSGQPGSSVSGSQVFNTRLRNADAYQVAIVAQPAGQQCTLSSGSGVIASSDAFASISCQTIVPLHTLEGTVSGLNGTVVLRTTGVSDLAISGDGPFAFDASVPPGTPYNVTVASQPSGQQCVVAGGSGTVSGNVTTIAVTCTTLVPHTIGGRVIGVGSSIVLRNNGGNDLTIGNDGTFTFTSPLIAGQPYATSVSSADANQKCLVAGGSGTMPDANVATVRVVCNNKRATRAAYVVNRTNGLGGSGYISQYEVGTNGLLTPLTPATIAAGVNPLSMSIDATGSFAYVRSVDPNQPAVSATGYRQFTISANGALTPMAVPVVDAGGPAEALALHPSGSYAYASRGQDVLRFLIGTDGSLGVPTVQNILSAGGLGAITFDRAGEIAYIIGVDGAGELAIYQYRVNNDGSLTALSPGVVPVAVTFLGTITTDPFDRSVYAVDGAFGRIMQFQRALEGTLTALNPSFLYNATLFPDEIHVEPFGAFAYTSAPGSISQFRIGSLAGLTPNTPVSTLPGAQESFTSLAIDLAGAYVYATSMENADRWVRQYAINSDGTLTRIDAGSVATGADPVQIVVTP